MIYRAPEKKIFEMLMKFYITNLEYFAYFLILPFGKMQETGPFIPIFFL